MQNIKNAQCRQVIIFHYPTAVIVSKFWKIIARIATANYLVLHASSSKPKMAFPISVFDLFVSLQRVKLKVGSLQA